jgi:tetratricopeptide (TPR) repeat protein
MSSFKGHIDTIPPSIMLLMVIGLAVFVTSVVTGKTHEDAAQEGAPIFVARDLEKTGAGVTKHLDNDSAIKDLRPYAKEAVRHYNAGIEAHQHGFFVEAIAEYKAAIEADNRMGEAYCNLGVIYGGQHKFDDALACFEKASELMPTSALTLNGLADVLSKMGRTEAAIIKWRRVIEIDPNFKSAYVALAKALKETGHSDEAQKVLDAAPKS